MTVLDAELATYKELEPELEMHSHGKWVLIKGSKLVSTYGTFDAAAKSAMRLYGRGPYLIRPVGAPPLLLQATVVRAAC